MLVKRAELARELSLGQPADRVDVAVAIAVDRAHEAQRRSVAPGAVERGRRPPVDHQRQHRVQPMVAKRARLEPGAPPAELVDRVAERHLAQPREHRRAQLVVVTVVAEVPAGLDPVGARPEAPASAARAIASMSIRSGNPVGELERPGGPQPGHRQQALAADAAVVGPVLLEADLEPGDQVGALAGEPGDLLGPRMGERVVLDRDPIAREQRVEQRVGARRLDRQIAVARRRQLRPSPPASAWATNPIAAAR